MGGGEDGDGCRVLKFSQLLRSVLIPNKDGLLFSAEKDEYYGMTGETRGSLTGRPSGTENGELRRRRG